MDYSPGYDKTKPITSWNGHFNDECIGGAWHIDSNNEYCVRCERPFKKYPDRDSRDAERTRQSIFEALGYDDPEALDPNIDEPDDGDYFDGKLPKEMGNMI